MPNIAASTLNFPRFLLPAFPRWDSSLLKRHRPVEDVTAAPAVTATRRQQRRPSTSSSISSSSSSSSTCSEERQDPPARQARILSHDSGCIVSDEDESNDGNDERSYTYAPSSAATSSSNSLEVYLDTESGYGGSTDDVTISRPTITGSSSSSSSVPQNQSHLTTPRKTRKFPFWPSSTSSSKTRKSQITPLPTPPTLQTTTTYLTCSTCHTNLCFTSAVISKGFTGRHGRAYLVSQLLPSNIIHGKPTSRALQTGAHTVSDVSCKICGSTLGWKYIHAEERGQRYKVGKYILETGRVGKVNYWDGRVDDNDGEGEKGGSVGDDDEVEVDLADEEELEEMFAGSWNKEKVVRRRERKKQVEEVRRKADSNV